MKTSTEETSIIIVGGGPTGVVLSALLGRAGIRNVVLEREAEITVDPRGIALDEDGIRILQAIGAYDRIFSEAGSCMQRFNFITGTGHDLYKKPLLSIDYGTSEGGTGHIGFICHKQPVLERIVRDVIEQNEYSELRSSCTVTGIEENDDQVTVEYTDPHGEQRLLSSRFLIGADGKTGFVRKKYLEPRGITMDRCEGTNYNETWVAVNWQISLPTPKTHPSFPLWEQGYTPSQVYDLFFPVEFRFLCNPNRPAVCGRFGLPEDRLWRFECVVHKDEDGHLLSTPEQLHRIIFPYLTHPGSRYGMPGMIQYPADCIKTLRARPFSFSARSCNRWSHGRVVIAGDAAHVFPPFGGQGIASGFRDAMALAWRLRLLVQQPELNHNTVLKSWYLERKQQLERSLAATIQNGEYVTERDPLKILIRDWWLWLQQLVPSRVRELEKGPRALGMTCYGWEKGLPFLPTGGKLLPQVYARCLSTDEVVFTDDLLFSPKKKALFQVLALTRSSVEAANVARELRSLQVSDASLVDPCESTVLLHDHYARISDQDESLITIARTASGEEFGQSELCRNRPKPRYYDESRLLKEFEHAKFLLVRPDRFVYASCRNLEEFASVLTSVKSVVTGV